MKRLLTLLLTITFILSSAPSVFAVTPEQLENDHNDAVYQDPGQGPACSETTAGVSGGTAVTITGNNVKTGFDYFLSQGFSAAQTAGIIGNLMYESNDLDPTDVETGGGGGYGIAQFTPPTAMETWVTAQGEDPTSLQGQLDYLGYDFVKNSPDAVSAVKATSTVADATKTFMIQYERPNGSNTIPITGDAASSLPDRVADAQEAYTQYSGDSGTVTPAGGDSNCVSSAGSTDCASVTGNAKILCAAEPYAGIYYEYGGGHEYLDNGGIAAFLKACPDPANPPNNQPYGGPSLGGQHGNPSPCATDCSALVSIAVDLAFNQDFSWSVGTLQADTTDWQPISMTSVQTGDVVVNPQTHVEIVDHYDPSTGLVYTFGSHATGTETGPTSYTLIGGEFSLAYRYIGPTQ